MHLISLILLIAALVVFILAALRVVPGARVDLLASGLALLAGSQLAARLGA